MHLASSINSKNLTTIRTKQLAMTLFLTLHTGYNDVKISLESDGKILQQTEVANKLASSNLIPTIDSLLKSENLKLSDLKFIAVNAGPAPFTSLRTTIATANGISFSSKIPLVSVCSIEELVKNSSNPQFNINIALLNAFGQDVYFAINKDNTIKIGVENIEQLLEKLKLENKTINFFGNGTELYKNLIIEKLSDRAHIEPNFVLECPVEYISKAGLAKYNRKEFTYKILPLYLKEYKVN